jgi:hypothetical protein
VADRLVEGEGLVAAVVCLARVAKKSQEPANTVERRGLPGRVGAGTVELEGVRGVLEGVGVPALFFQYPGNVDVRVGLTNQITEGAVGSEGMPVVGGSLVETPDAHEGPQRRRQLPRCGAPVVVAVGRRRRLRLRRFVAAQDDGVHTSQGRARIDPEIVGQPDPGFLVCGKGIGLPAGSVQGQHELRDQPFPQRVEGDQFGEFTHDLLVLIELQFQVEPMFKARQPLFV